LASSESRPEAQPTIMNTHADDERSCRKGNEPRPQWVESRRLAARRVSDALGMLLVDVFHNLALFAIGATIVWSAVVAFLAMAHKGSASVDDILLLFIYLELGAMVGIYFKTNHMPVRFLLYIAMTSLTRLLISDAYLEHGSGIAVILVPVAILLLALATLAIRFGSARFPSVQSKAAWIDGSAVPGGET